MTGTDVDPRTTHHAALGPLLFTVAYEILGSAVDAEHVVRQCLCQSPPGPGEVGSGDARTHFTALVVPRAVDALAVRRRAADGYVGPWLPEPIRLDDDPMADGVLAEAVSTARLVVLEELEPEARAVYVLGEVFGFGATRSPRSCRRRRGPWSGSRNGPDPSSNVGAPGSIRWTVPAPRRSSMHSCRRPNLVTPEPC